MEFDLALIAERKIEEAIAEGKFTDLPGKGCPLDLDKDAGIPMHLRILRNAGVPPEWALLEEEIAAARSECAQLWAQTERLYPVRRARLQEAAGDAGSEDCRSFSQWIARARAEYLEAVGRVNTAILKLNYHGPRIQRVHQPLSAAAEAERFDRAFPSLPGVMRYASHPSASREGTLRAAAYSLYRYGDGKVSLP
ncbi:MAG: DnaJ family domain-containing protein [Chthonomonadales bacterium]